MGVPPTGRRRKGTDPSTGAAWRETDLSDSDTGTLEQVRDLSLHLFGQGSPGRRDTGHAEDPLTELRGELTRWSILFLRLTKRSKAQNNQRAFTPASPLPLGRARAPINEHRA